MEMRFVSKLLPDKSFWTPITHLYRSGFVIRWYVHHGIKGTPPAEAGTVPRMQHACGFTLNRIR